MLDIQKTKNDFHALSLPKKYDELVKIFGSIKEKNENCAYIYEKLTTKPELFDEELMESMFVEVIALYEKVNKKNATFHMKHFEKSIARIEQINRLEKAERAEEQEACEQLLQF